MPELRYCVLLEGLSELKPPLIAQALAAHLGVPAADAARAARQCWGIPLEAADKETAAALVGRLSERGLRALAVPTTLLEDLPAAAPASRVEFSESGLIVHTQEGAARSEWGDITLVAAAAFLRSASRPKAGPDGPSVAEKAIRLGLAMSGIPPSLALPTPPGSTPPAPETDLAFSAFVVAGKPAFRVLVEGDHFDYSGLGPRMAYNSLMNFKAVLAEIQARGPAALVNRGLTAMSRGEILSSLGYESLKDLERECRWLLTLRTLKKA